MEHLIDIENISKEDILNIIETAKEFKNGTKKSDVSDKTLALMFYENSTRTRCSFEMAGQNLGMKIINGVVPKYYGNPFTIETPLVSTKDIAIYSHPKSG
jgi:aspartate carbamoyltransferase catalytic subunit